MRNLHHKAEVAADQNVPSLLVALGNALRKLGLLLLGDQTKLPDALHVELHCVIVGNHSNTFPKNDYASAFRTDFADFFFSFSAALAAIFSSSSATRRLEAPPRANPSFDSSLMRVRKTRRT